eukprot:jgi/Mesen1/781/ME000110S_11047
MSFQSSSPPPSRDRSPPSFQPSINPAVAIAGFVLSSSFILCVCLRIICVQIMRNRRRHAAEQNGEITVIVTGQRPMRGLPEEVIAGFPTFKYQPEGLEKKDTQCCICLGDYEPEEEVKNLPDCEHSFHLECIDAWLKQHTTCPICRRSLEPPPAGLDGKPGPWGEAGEGNVECQVIPSPTQASSSSFSSSSAAAAAPDGRLGGMPGGESRVVVISPGFRAAPLGAAAASSSSSSSGTPSAPLSFASAPYAIRSTQVEQAAAIASGSGSGSGGGSGSGSASGSAGGEVIVEMSARGTSPALAPASAPGASSLSSSSSTPSAYRHPSPPQEGEGAPAAGAAGAGTPEAAAAAAEASNSSLASRISRLFRV